LPRRRLAIDSVATVAWACSFSVPVSRAGDDTLLPVGWACKRQRISSFLLLSFLFLHFSFNLPQRTHLSLSKTSVSPSTLLKSTTLRLKFPPFSTFSSLFSPVLTHSFVKNPLPSAITQIFTTKTLTPNFTFSKSGHFWLFLGTCSPELASCCFKLQIACLFAPFPHHFLSLRLPPPLKSS